MIDDLDLRRRILNQLINAAIELYATRRLIIMRGSDDALPAINGVIHEFEKAEKVVKEEMLHR